MSWPELSALQDSRLAVYEDRFDAELACGAHQNVVGELEVLVETEPLRERLCGQLMIAAYRCGRQVDALAVYRATRAALIEQLGVEPCRELQELERAILNHSPDLTLPAQAAPVVIAVADPADVPGNEAPLVERRWVSVLLVAANLDPRVYGSDVEEFADAHTSTADTIRAEAERFDGTVISGIGSTWWVVFGVRSAKEDDAERAVRAAVAIRNRCHETWPSPRFAVTTGDALVTHRPDAPPAVTGTVMRQSWNLVTTASANDVRVCEVTRRASEGTVVCSVSDDPSTGCLVEAIRARPVQRVAAPFVERDRELDLLRGLLGNVVRHRRPHLMTVLGEPGLGKTRLLAELARAAEDSVQCLVGRASAFAENITQAALSDIIVEYAGIGEKNTVVDIGRKLAGVVSRLMGDGETATWMLSHLRRLVLGGHGDVADAFAACRTVLEEIAVVRPLVLVFEDLHQADDTLLDFVGELAERAAKVPLFVVVTARPELLERRPDWGRGRRGATATTLDRLSDAATSRLLGHLVETHGMSVSPGGELVASVGGNPLFATEYARMLRDDGSAVRPPQSVRGVIAARLDTLTPAAKAVLQDAALFGDVVWADAVAAVGERNAEEVARLLEHLEARDFLRFSPRARTASEIRYTFGHALVRDVAYGQMARSVRTRKHRLAAEWIERSLGGDSDLLARHRDALTATRAPRTVPSTGRA